MTPTPRRTGLVAACLALAFLVSAVAWNSRATVPLHYGDACVSATRLLECSDAMSRLDGLHRWISDEVWTRTTRAPLMTWLALLWIRLPGLDAADADLLPALLLALGGAWTVLAVARQRGSLLAGAAAGLLLLGSLQAIIQAHTFFLETAALAWTALALVGAEGVHRRRRLAPLWLGLGLGGALLSRHNAAASLALPVLLWAAPPVLRLAVRRPLRLLAGGLLLAAALGGGAVLAAAQLPVERALTTGPLLLAPTLLAAAAWTWWRPRSGAARLPRPLALGRDLALSLWIAAAISLPWWIGHRELILSHLEGSSGPGHSTAASAGRLWTFMLQVIGLQQLGLALVPLGVVGLLLALGRLREPVTRLAAIGLATAFATFPLYFHSRYLLPLLPFVAVLASAALPDPRPGWRRTLASALVAGLALVAVLRHAGWALGLPVLPRDFVRDEHLSWHEDDRELAAFLVRPWLQPLVSVAPPSVPDVFGDALAEVDRRCPAGRVCGLYVPQPPPPPGLLGLSTFDDHDWLRFRLVHAAFDWRIWLLPTVDERMDTYALVLDRDAGGPPRVRGIDAARWEPVWEPRPVEDGVVGLWALGGTDRADPPAE